MAQRRLVELVLKGKDESQGAFKSLEQSFMGVTGKQALFAAGALAVAAGMLKAGKAVYDFTAEMAALGDEMDKVHQRTGVAVETLSELDFAIQRGGGSSGDTEAAIRRLARSMGDATDNIKEAVDSFAMLGITTDQLVGPGGELVDISVVLPMIANGLQRISSQASRMDIAQALLGRGGTKLLPALQQGREGLKAMREELEKYGGPMSASFSAKSAEFVDAQLNIATATQRLKEALSEPFMTPFTNAVNTLAEAIADGANIAKGVGDDGQRSPGRTATNPLWPLFIGRGIPRKPYVGPGDGDPYSDYLARENWGSPAFQQPATPAGSLGYGPEPALPVFGPNYAGFSQPQMP
ncbi:MAG: hypothetical protein DRQ62_15395, partial [Gammaproteobacteria bacterium]